MAYGKISKKQQEILDYLKREIMSHGYPPTVREICDAVHLKSTSSVHSHLESLEKNGYIRRDPAKPRAIEVVDDAFNVTRREVASIPLVGQVAAGFRSSLHRISKAIFRFLPTICRRIRLLCCG